MKDLLVLFKSQSKHVKKFNLQTRDFLWDLRNDILRIIFKKKFIRHKIWWLRLFILPFGAWSLTYETDQYNKVREASLYKKHTLTSQLLKDNEEIKMNREQYYHLANYEITRLPR